ncbi:unnamed protein product [Tilletia controversa]|uniref:ER membrane protein complex subunit 7 beta-sandwich domain-containing protein n=3 Tax=Tilletia TaxID=13289 RepID=A0A8X7MYQ0_9BASI|nr:hypothetical protein CF328_g3702 [Tilletia controversa]KAE8198980.1 hypothetical protein CF336_g1428 [Tilletia laevis]KAE8264087.1 hypothetical protein A4X03_0g1205 [Tilletia caries]KAE8203098.1 hypothetical protein CF335_g3167 [Tilletia laevis]KAE8252878.1 hypothetical protein A4X06_0g1871 [Tilletia controversa]
MKCTLTRLTWLSAALAALAGTAAALDFRVQLVTNQYLQDVQFLTSQSPATLRRIPTSVPGARENASVPKVMRTLARRDGSVVFSDVAPGAWLLDIQAPYLIFNQYRVDIPEPDAVSPPTTSAGEGLTWKGLPAVRVHLRGYSLESTLLSPALPYPLIAGPIGKQGFFTEPEKFNIKSLLANPMILMGGVGMLLIFVVPKLQSQLDPEAQAEMRASQASMQKKMAAFQSGDLGALFREDAPTRPSAGPSAVQAAGGSGSGKKR